MVAITVRVSVQSSSGASARQYLSLYDEFYIVFWHRGIIIFARFTIIFCRKFVTQMSCFVDNKFDGVLFKL